MIGPIDVIEQLRPIWAQGHTDDGVAAQSFGNELLSEKTP